MLKPKPSAPAAAAATPREAARALLSMLGEAGPGPAGAVPEAQMRLLARDLIAQVEGRARAPAPPPPEDAAPRRRLFSRAAPLAVPPRAEPAPAPAPPVAEAAPATGLPAALSVGSADGPRAARLPAALTADQVRRLVAEAEGSGETEHPAIVALTLEGRAPLEQAEALRRLPRGQARAVHRALRMLAPSPG